MTGLSETERVGCRRLLGTMSNGDLSLLCDTVTNKMITVENPTEAMEAILAYTKDAEELLKRKKVHRNLIFMYLAQEGIVMPPNSEKHVLVKRTLDHWSSGKVLVASETRLLAAEMNIKPDQMEPNASFNPLVLGQQFCQWFFQLLNSQNLSRGQQPQDWGPQHFWPDAKLRLISSTDSHQTEEFEGAELVSLRLLALAKDECLIFSPNLEPHGLRVTSSAHGLVLVAVAGTIHRDASCLGIYEQAFGLIRSPQDSNSWKIKFVNLRIRGRDILMGAEELSPSLTLDSNELQLLCR